MGSIGTYNYGGILNVTKDTMLVVAIAATATAYMPRVGIGAPITPEPVVTFSNSSFVRTSAFAEINYFATDIWPEAKARLKALKGIGEDHDGEGAQAPIESAVEAAISFVHYLPAYAPTPIVGVDSAGQAVVDFRDGEEFGQVVFVNDTEVEAYFESRDRPSVFIEGQISNPEFASLFVATFGFRLLV